MHCKFFLVVGARPNFVKIAPLTRELKTTNIEFKLIHTGQHYDDSMSSLFFKDLEIPKPDVNLNIGSESHATQTAKIMVKFERVLIKETPDLVIVVGDVNSTLACALVAKKMNIKVAHIEAGLRSFDQTMPEEINRILTDHISDLLFTTEESANKNLRNEGINQDKVYFVGNIMIDSLIYNIKKAREKYTYKQYDLNEKEFALITLHRPSNVDNYNNLQKIIDMIEYVGKFTNVIFPIHPRTKNKLREFNLEQKLIKANVLVTDPLSYLNFINLMINSKFILTDSGGIQEEASFLTIPVLTLRKNTERPVTVVKGSNTIINDDFNLLKVNVNAIINGNYKKPSNIEKWDGKTSIRIIEVLKKMF